MDINSTHRGDQLNSPSNRPPVSHSRLPLNWNFFHTLAFGKVSPIAPIELVKGDKYRLNLSHDITTMSLKSPLLSSLAIHRDFCSIPLEAILPLNSDKVVVQPNIGDDVPRDVNCVVEHFPELVSNLIGYLFMDYFPSDYDPENDDPDEWIESWCLALRKAVQALVIGEYFYSNGSLLKYCGYSMSKLFKWHEKPYNSKSYDQMFDAFMRKLSSIKLDFNFGLPSDPTSSIQSSRLVRVRTSSRYNGESFVGLNRLLELVRDVPFINALVPFYDFEGEYYSSDQIATILSNAGVHDFWSNKDYETVIPDVPFNMSRIAGYQLAYYQFFTNDRVDNIYDANLYREVLGYYYRKTVDSAKRPEFSWNGVNYGYDWLSGKCLADVLFYLSGDDDSLFGNLFISYLFGYRNSLKYSDYFTGSKTRPLAVGDTNIQVSSQGVDVVDVTRKIQAQKFLNAVNRVGRKFSDYMTGIFGGSVPNYDYHYPAHIVGTTDYIRNNEVQNTGSDQLTEANSRTSMFNDSASKYILEFTADRNCVIIGLEWFDIRRAYTNATERQLFHVDRFDMFNPYFQFIGDQAVRLAELDMSLANDSSDNFGYTTRYMEYKQKFDQAVGGFVENLPSWSFLADDSALVGKTKHLDSDYIRSSCTELDKFFVQLGGYSLGSYFHFVVASVINYDGTRPMVVSPDIL